MRAATSASVASRSRPANDSEEVGFQRSSVPLTSAPTNDGPAPSSFKLRMKPAASMLPAWLSTWNVVSPALLVSSRSKLPSALAKIPPADLTSGFFARNAHSLIPSLTIFPLAVISPQAIASPVLPVAWKLIAPLALRNANTGWPVPST